MIRALGNALLAVVLAPACACCGRALEDPLGSAVCAPCWSGIPESSEPVCDICGDTLPTWRTDAAPSLCVRCRRRGRIISRGRSIGPYEGTLREILHALKYGKRRSLARPLGHRMAAAGRAVLHGADCVVPVPLHFLRGYSRGFNQAAALAEHVGVPAVHALRRTRMTVTQTNLPESERHGNVNGAFALRRRADVNGLIVVVVDDVSTTGATVDACARTLLDAGAKEVRALTAARAVARLP